jgi:hypothetical protein
MITQLTGTHTFQSVRPAELHSAELAIAEKSALGPHKAKYVFSVALIYRISLTPRFSAVHGRLFYHNRFSGFLFHRRKTAEAVMGSLRASLNTQLKQGVNETVSQR